MIGGRAKRDCAKLYAPKWLLDKRDQMQMGHNHPLRGRIPPMSIALMMRIPRPFDQHT